MTQDEIIRMVREAGFTDYYPERLTRFAALVAAHERETLAEQEPVADDLIRKYVTAVVENKSEDAATILCSMVDYVFRPPSCALKGFAK